MCDGTERTLEGTGIGACSETEPSQSQPLLGKEIFLGKEYPLSELPGISYQRASFPLEFSVLLEIKKTSLASEIPRCLTVFQVPIPFPADWPPHQMPAL